jgi:hypothetical protein
VGSATREEAFAKWSTSCSLALLIPSTLAALCYAWRHSLVRLPPSVSRILCSRWLFFANIGLCLLLCRYPTLLTDEANADEGAFLTAAFKLFYDPNFFHAVDCSTNGPLNVYPLMLPALFGFSPDFASSRVLVIVIIVLCAFLLYRAVSLLAPEELARFAVLPWVGGMASFKSTELCHYSSEYVPLLLIAITLYSSTCILRDRARYQVPVFFLGLLAGAAFLAKMQSVPIVLSLAGVALAYVYASRSAETKWRPALLFIAGVLPLLLLNTVLCLSAGVWKDFWTTYIRANINYAAGGTAGLVADLHLFAEFVVQTPEVRSFLFTVLAITITYFALRARQRRAPNGFDPLIPVVATFAIVTAQTFLRLTEGWTVYTYLVLVALWMTLLYVAVLCSRKPLNLSPTGWFGLLALFSSVAAFYSVYRAHHPFQHYLLFLFLPLCAVMSWMLVQQARPVAGSRRTSDGIPHGLAFIALLLVFTFTYQSYLWSFQDDDTFKRVGPWIRPGEGDFVRSITSPGPTVFVWGWNDRPYLGSARVPSGRSITVADCFRSYNLWTSPPTFAPSRESLKLDAYYQKRIVRDLIAHPPELFIDVIGPGSWFLNDPKYFSVERVPALNEFVKANYVLFGEMYDQRYYLRRDLPAKQSFVRLPKECTPGALQCLSMPAHISTGGTLLTEVHDLPAISIPTHALIEAEFIAAGLQAQDATVFNNQTAAESFRGFRFESIGGQRYRLLLGSGHNWASSKSILLAPNQPVSLSIEIKGNDVFIRCNSHPVDNMHLPSLMVNTSSPLNVGSWINGQCRFLGAVQFFEILDLEKSKRVQSK